MTCLRQCIEEVERNCSTCLRSTWVVGSTHACEDGVAVAEDYWCPNWAPFVIDGNTVFGTLDSSTAKM